MPKLSPAAGRFAWLTFCLVLLSACSPSLDWREVRDTDSRHTALYPAKPATHTRTITLAGSTVDMTMRGAEAEGVTYAIGTIRLSDAQRAQEVAAILRQAMIANIAGTVRSEKQITASGMPMTEVVAEGRTQRGEALALHARFAARGERAYQAIVLGPSNRVSAEAAETFLESFKPE